MQLNSVVLLVVGVMIMTCSAIPGKKGKRSPMEMPGGFSIPPNPFPMPPMPFFTGGSSRFARHAPSGMPAPPKPPSASRFARQVPSFSDMPAPPMSPSDMPVPPMPPMPPMPSSRFARQAIEAEPPKHIRQDSFYSSITSVSRKKRSQVAGESSIRG